MDAKMRTPFGDPLLLPLRLLGSFLLHQGEVSLSWRLQEALETRPHSFDILVIVIIITLLVVLIRGILLRFPLTPRLGATLLKLLSGDVLFLLLLLLFLRQAFSYAFE